MPDEKLLLRSHKALLDMRQHPGNMSYNQYCGSWFYTIPQQWRRSITGQGATPEEAIEQAIRQLQDN